MSYIDYIIQLNNTVSYAIARLETLEHKILFVSDNDDICGVVTDGDIRRYLLTGQPLSAPVMDAASVNPIKLSGYHEAKAREMLKEYNIQCVPMLDRFGKLHALVFDGETIHRESESADTPVIMMAGGYGTRLQPYTAILPKPLIPAGGVTITEQILNRFKKFGFYNFTLVVNYKKNLIKSYFSEVDTGANLSFVDEETPLGTGGGLWVFKGRFDSPVLVTYCDSVIEADYGEILERHIQDGNLFTMVCARKKLEIPYGVIETDETGALCGLTEKPCFEFLTNTGFYVLSPEFFEQIEDNKFALITDIVERCRKQGGRIGVYTIEKECFIDMGQREDRRSVENKLGK